MTSADRARIDRAIGMMVQSAPWHETLRRFQWNDRYLSGESFGRFVESEEARVRSILTKLGTAASATSSSARGFYPAFVLAGLAVTVVTFVGTIIRGPKGLPVVHRGIGLIAVALIVDMLLIERAGFIVASIPLFWLTARAFDEQHPVRDALAAVVLSVSSYLLFARLLQISLPAGVLAGWI